MSNLNLEHPDFYRKPGDKRTVDGVEMTYGENQFREYWFSGPKDGTVTCTRDEPHPYPYRSGGRSFRDLESAASYARRTAKSEYEKAKEIVARYEKGDK